MRTAIIPLLLLPAAALADDWAPAAEQTAVYKALSVHEPAPTCDQVEALAAEPAATLRVVIERATMPPWAPMRAAHCLVTNHPTEARADMLAWVGSEQTRGLAILAIGQLETMPEAIALEVATAALAGPLESDARERLVDSEVDVLRELVAK